MPADPSTPSSGSALTAARDTDSRPTALLVTGGAGYIGSHTVRHLQARHERLVVLDNLVFGHAEAVRLEQVEFVHGDMADAAVVESIFSRYQIEAVLHFAAYCYVGESVEQPLKYYQNNTAAPLVVLDAMRRHGCRQFILSTTCATYGDPVRMPMDESHPQNPINPYGRSKWMLELILRDLEPAAGIRSVFLRYFNASGCDPSGEIGEDHDPETHIIPNVLMAVTGERENFTIFGTDYPTPDGTCIRDYIHVVDLARAHALALDYLRQGGATTACNLGTGRGASVREIIDTAEQVTGKKVPLQTGPRRAGDPAELVADPSLAREVLGWEAEHKDVRYAIETAWAWMTGPRGGRYGS